jgi:uncharacterized repeat protein (TIGR03806 family)
VVDSGDDSAGLSPDFGLFDQDQQEDIEEEAGADLVADQGVVSDVTEDVSQDFATVDLSTSDSGETVGEDLGTDGEIGEDTSDLSGDLTPVEISGLNERPANPDCFLGDTPEATQQVRTTRVFNGLSFDDPVALYQAPEDSDYWYLVEKEGNIIRFENTPDEAFSSSDTETFLDISSRVYSSESETGLLGIAFHPDYQSNGQIYLSYNNRTGGRTYSRISRFSLDASGEAFDADSEEILLSIEQPAGNHNGGDLKFGPDGYLYAAFGDGGNWDDWFDNGQDTDTLLATILRLDVDSEPASGLAYAIPPDNPFVDGGGRAEIFAYGLRNPWRFSFDRETGELWAGDVGQGDLEEVDVVVNGGNYGWPIFEGTECYLGSAGECAGLDHIPPVTEYSHSEGYSITGGYVYRGSNLSLLVGDYLFGDYGYGTIWAYSVDPVTGEGERTSIVNTALFISSFAESHEGEIFVIDYNGSIYELTPRESSGDTFPLLLSETGCVDSDDPTLPAEGMIPFVPNMWLWSDDADKNRWFALPDGSQIDVDENGDFLFPVGTVTMKEFRLGDRRVETRIMSFHEDGTWGGYTYVWNEEETEAYLDLVGGDTDVEGQNWPLLSTTQCNQCHTVAANNTLGLEMAQLNSDFTYPSTGRTANQITTLGGIGLFAEGISFDPDDYPALPPIDSDAPIEDRARAYLHTNCAGCHQPGGPAFSTQDLRYHVSLSEMKICNEITISPEGLEMEDPIILSPGDPEGSLLWLRMNSRDVYQMPPLGTNIVDPEGAVLISDWITGIETCP